MTIADYMEVMEVNLYGMINMVDTFLPLLKKQTGSRIVNTASIYGRVAAKNSGPYSVSKFGVEAYSDVLR